MEEKLIKTNGCKMPQLQIKSDEVEPVENYESLRDLFGRIFIVKNKLDPEIILVGTLITREGHYRVNGTSFKKSAKGGHHIVNNIYERDATAQYGLEENEFETRMPCYIRDLERGSSIQKDLETISSFPHIEFGRPKSDSDLGSNVNSTGDNL